MVRDLCDQVFDLDQLAVEDQELDHDDEDEDEDGLQGMDHDGLPAMDDHQGGMDGDQHGIQVGQGIMGDDDVDGGSDPASPMDIDGSDWVLDDAGEPSPPEETFTVEKIINHRWRGRQRQFRVKWQGYSAKHNSWEPAEHFVSPQVVADYLQALKDKQRKRKKKRRL
jgi:hypothetical protein